jgi:hypothetical protein
MTASTPVIVIQVVSILHAFAEYQKTLEQLNGEDLIDLLKEAKLAIPSRV